ncbi:MAG: hypothetical protein ACP5SC_00460 [Desulfurella sp.]
MQKLFNALKDNGTKIINLLKEKEYKGDELLSVLNERNKLFETIYKTKITNQYLDQIKELLEQNAQIEFLVEQKKKALLEDYIKFYQNSKNIMKYLKQGG